MIKRNWLLTVEREVMVSSGTLVAGGGLLVVLSGGSKIYIGSKRIYDDSGLISSQQYQIKMLGQHSEDKRRQKIVQLPEACIHVCGWS